MDKTNITTTIWKDTRDKLRVIAGLTHESMVLILHRLISTEFENVARASAAKPGAKHFEILEFFKEKDGVVGWEDLPKDKWDAVFDAVQDGLIQSFRETESYQITEEGRKL